MRHEFRLSSLTLALALAAGLASTPALAQRGDDSDRVSKNGKAVGAIDSVGITLEFGRPTARGRELWGGLVPYGKVWRTGANEATTLSLDRDALVEGEPLAAGTYALFTIPGETEWTVILNREANQWGAFNHDPAQDALRVVVTPEPAEHTETLDIAIEGEAVVLRWGELRVPVRVAAAR